MRSQFVSGPFNTTNRQGPVMAVLFGTRNKNSKIKDLFEFKILSKDIGAVALFFDDLKHFFFGFRFNPTPLVKYPVNGPDRDLSLSGYILYSNNDKPSTLKF